MGYNKRAALPSAKTPSNVAARGPFIAWFQHRHCSRNDWLELLTSSLTACMSSMPVFKLWASGSVVGPRWIIKRRYVRLLARSCHGSVPRAVVMYKLPRLHWRWHLCALADRLTGPALHGSVDCFRSTCWWWARIGLRVGFLYRISDHLRGTETPKRSHPISSCISARPMWSFA